MEQPVHVKRLRASLCSANVFVQLREAFSARNVDREERREKPVQTPGGGGSSEAALG